MYTRENHAVREYEGKDSIDRKFLDTCLTRPFSVWSIWSSKTLKAQEGDCRHCTEAHYKDTKHAIAQHTVYDWESRGMNKDE